ncbi:MAG TPA: hypothetical protein VL475_05765 [Planctomycetaceae bacterium]|nr:hypothetical protein [Planctomycetaceae bacterium]
MSKMFAALWMTFGAMLLVAEAARGNEVAEIRPVILENDGRTSIEWHAGKERVGLAPDGSPCGVELRLPGAAAIPLRFTEPARKGDSLEFAPIRHGPLAFVLRITQKTPSLIERSVEVTTTVPAKFALSFSFFPAANGQYASFAGDESAAVVYDTLGGGPEYPQVKGQTFPVAMVRQRARVFGLLAESPGVWENRCQIHIDPVARRLGATTGDGRDPYDLQVKFDARDKYRYQMNGWQSLEPNETRRFTTWLFASSARSHYDAQVAAHVALANAKGWNHSAVEAILRNTSYLLLRRNLMRDEGRFVFISGIGYGWKQWVSDGFYVALGLDDPEKSLEACRSVFLNRITYEDNAQYYLIWSALVKRAGGLPNETLIRQAYEFIRRHEKDGIFYPPPLPGAPNPKGWKTYMDLLPYDDDDAPASNQGFHCGALMAARELGHDVTERDIEQAIAGYRRMFNHERGFLPTSLKQPDVLGQDTLYGATLTYAVFGRKLLTDEQVLAHHRTSLKTASPYGLRVISQADGALLPGHNGEYVHGGSWFLCDAANFLLAGVHGLPAEEVDELLIRRIEQEIAHVPAFHESISTVTGRPHGHILYSWNSGYWWLRREIRKRLGQNGRDPVDEAIDRKLGIARDDRGLRLYSTGEP